MIYIYLFIFERQYGASLVTYTFSRDRMFIILSNEEFMDFIFQNQDENIEILSVIGPVGCAMKN